MSKTRRVESRLGQPATDKCIARREREPRRDYPCGRALRDLTFHLDRPMAGVAAACVQLTTYMTSQARPNNSDRGLIRYEPRTPPRGSGPSGAVRDLK